MKLITQEPKKALKAFLKQKPLRSEIDVFKANLIKLLDKISIIDKRPKDESEEHLKNDLRDFLRDTYYKETNAINTKDKKDLVIHLGKTTDDKVGVIIEAKRPANSNEMVTADNPNKKALHELILYYLDERNKEENNELKQLIITNVYEWYIIDANFFDKHIYRNTQIKKLYELKGNDKKDNPFFYEEVAKIIGSLDIEIPCVYFDIRKYDAILRNNKKEDDRELSALLKILSPQHLLKILTPNDSNSLNEKFYKELLHIIGLEEAKEDNKNIIRRKKDKRNAASLLELTIDALITDDPFHRLPDQTIYGQNKEERIFNVSLELCITWINRILFLKLLEGQLITYHEGNKDYRFLNTETLKDFDELYKLFHKVLAVNLSERSEAIKAKYNRVPYLNSSLFEISELEDQTIKINSLDNSGLLELIGNSILKDSKKKSEKLPTLDYLFHFLDAYDFASEGTDEVQEDNKTIINASVLGKVFEKINGYKDGSIFTPAFITMYMCKQSIRLAVVQKFNEALSEKGETKFDKFEDLRNYTTRLFKTQEILKANEIINSLRICDPAVGSGHFLVSSLNEIISIKADLGILADKDGNSISGYEIEIVNDELIITDPKTNILEYKLRNGKPLNKDMQRLQKTLFYEKQTIIENCLFGVDINSNSVKICRLRLWIELLKNAYYKEETNYLELETLPNIDINIKCGNSLLSRFVLDSDLSKALKKYDVKAYRGFVNDYKNEKSRDVKRELTKVIENIKGDFVTHIGRNNTEQKKLNKLNEEFQNKYVANKLFSQKLTTAQEKDKQSLKKKVEAQQKIIDDAKANVIYKNAFEWRFEFPEVLNNNGDFEGFDVVIANPPYIVMIKSVFGVGALNIINNLYKTAEYNPNTYTLFTELIVNKILKKSGIFTLIMPNTWLDGKYFTKMRELVSNVSVSQIVNLKNTAFDEIVETVILLGSNLAYNKPPLLLHYKAGDFRDYDKSFELGINPFNTITQSPIIQKMEKESKKIKDFALVYRGIETRENDKWLSETKQKGWQEILLGRDINRYTIQYSGTYINFIPKEMKSNANESLYRKPKILMRRTGNSIIATADTENRLALKNLYLIIPEQKENLFCILGQLNSSLFSYFHISKTSGENKAFAQFPGHYVENFPCRIDDKISKEISSIVKKIIEKKQDTPNASTTALELKIDELVYKLYGITTEEQKIIEGK